jgi:hypothetical protein
LSNLQSEFFSNLLGFKIRRLAHVVLQVTDLERSLLFDTGQEIRIQTILNP